MLLCCYVVLLVGILLHADPSFATEVIEHAEEALRERGTPAWMTWADRVEMMLNALLFAPLPVLASVAAPRHPWGNWVACAFVGSGLVEIVQAFAREPRSAQYVDVVANTLGGLVRAVLAIPLTMWMRRVSDEPSR